MDDKMKKRLMVKKKSLGATLINLIGDPPVKNWLDVIVRKIILRDNITNEIYKERVHEYSTRRSLTTTKQHNTANNMISSLAKGKLTLDTFLRFVCMLMGYRIKSISVTIERPDGTTFTEQVGDEDVD